MHSTHTEIGVSIMNVTTTTMPFAKMTVADFANLAQEQGKTFSELLVELWPEECGLNTSAKTAI
jgi:hypothetical protein